MNKIVTRTGVCMADDVLSHSESIEFEDNDSFIDAIIQYLPVRKDVIWEILYDNKQKHAALIYFDDNSNPDIDIIEDIRNIDGDIFCRHRYRYEFMGFYPDEMTLKDIKNKLTEKARL